MRSARKTTSVASKLSVTSSRLEQVGDGALEDDQEAVLEWHMLGMPSGVGQMLQCLAALPMR